MFWKKIKRYAALTSGNFEKIFGDRDVPPLPQVVTKLLEAIRDPDVHIENIANIISADVGLSTQILRLVNSALYSFPGEIASVQKAISLLGLKKIENIAISYAVMKAVKDPEKSGFDFNLFWGVSLYRAIVSRELTKVIGLGDPDEAFTGALLQDIALPVLLKDWFDVYEPVYKEWIDSPLSLHEIENQKLSWNHAQAGAWLAKKWKLPAILICCIGLHIENCSVLERLELDKTVVSSVVLSSKVPVGDKKDEIEIFLRESQRFNLELEQLKEITSKSYNLLSELSQSFGIRELKVKPFEDCLKKAGIK